MNFGTSQFLHSSPLSQAGRLDGLQDRSGSAAPQSRVDGRQCPLVAQNVDDIYLANSHAVQFMCRQRSLVDKTNHALAEKKIQNQNSFLGKTKQKEKTPPPPPTTTAHKHMLVHKAQYFNRCLLTLTVSGSCLVSALSDSWSLSTIQGCRRTQRTAPPK